MGIPTRTSAANKFLNLRLYFGLIEAPSALPLQVDWKRKIVCILNMLNIVYVMRIYCKFRNCLFLIKNVLPAFLCCLCASSERQKSYYYKVFIKVNEKTKNVEAAAAKHEEISPLSLTHFSASSTKNKKKNLCKFMNNIILIEKNENVDFDHENENDLIEKCCNRETTYFFASVIGGPTSPPISITKKK